MFFLCQCYWIDQNINVAVDLIVDKLEAVLSVILKTIGEREFSSPVNAVKPLYGFTVCAQAQRRRRRCFKHRGKRKALIPAQTIYLLGIMPV